MAKRSLSEYTRFTESRNLEFVNNNSIFEFKEWLEKDRNLAIKTITGMLNDVKIYLKVAWNFSAYINFYKGRTELRNPHESYKEEDVMQLINELMKRRDSTRFIEMNLPTCKFKQSRVWLTTACIVSFLYDVAG